MPVFDRDATRRIKQAVRRDELTPRSGVERAQRPQQDNAGSTRWFYTTSSITAATVSGSGVSGATMTDGSGTARICTLNQSTGVRTPVSTASDITIYNGVTTAISVNHFFLCQLSEGRWYAFLGPCS